MFERYEGVTGPGVGPGWKPGIATFTQHQEGFDLWEGYANPLVSMLYSTIETSRHYRGLVTTYHCRAKVNVE